MHANEQHAFYANEPHCSRCCMLTDRGAEMLVGDHRHWMGILMTVSKTTFIIIQLANCCVWVGGADKNLLWGETTCCCTNAVTEKLQPYMARRGEAVKWCVLYYDVSCCSILHYLAINKHVSLVNSFAFTVWLLSVPVPPVRPPMMRPAFVPHILQRPGMFTLTMFVYWFKQTCHITIFSL